MRFLLFILIFSAEAVAGRVIELGPEQQWVYVSHSLPHRWMLGDKACIGKEDAPLACGSITETFARYARLRIESHATLPTKAQVSKGKSGTFVSLPFKTRPVPIGALVNRKEVARSVASTPEPITVVTEAEPELNHFELLRDDVYPLNSVTIGLNLIFPLFHFQQSLTQNFAFGLGVTHMTLPQDNGQLKGPGVLFSLNWYSYAPYTGWYFELAAAVYDLRAEQGTIAEPIIGFSGIGYFGYKWRWSWGLNFGIGVGAQSFFTTRQNVASVSVPRVLPSLALDIGLSF